MSTPILAGQYVETLVIGGGQAGAGDRVTSCRGEILSFKIVDANPPGRGRVAQPVGLTPALHAQPSQHVSRGCGFPAITSGSPARTSLPTTSSPTLEGSTFR